MAPKNQIVGQPFWITSLKSKKIVHKWRSQEASILVGTKTVETDNPSLTTRLWKGNNPLRIVIDKDLKLDKTLNIFNQASTTIVFNQTLNKVSETVQYVKINFSLIHQEMMKTLYDKGIHSLII